MGRCQGRVCGPAAAEILAAALGKPVEAVGHFRAQPPVKPVPLTALGEATPAPFPSPLEGGVEANAEPLA
jgi:hypothetical protein